MKIYGIEKLSMVDFDGHLCTTIFTAGCNLRCPYCHNSVLVLGTNLVEVENAEVFDYLNKRKGIIDSVCVSGGEPTLQNDLPVFISKLKELGLLVKLDTNGTNPEMLKNLVENKLVDYVAMDIKSNKDGYLNSFGITQKELANIEQSIQYLKENHVPYEFRTTITSELFSKEVAQDMATWLSGSEKLFLQCFKDAGTNLKPGLSKIDVGFAEECKNILSKTIKRVELRGY
ncbi:MAG: anaerobic ribonucleoside-triphosphate reductase activating protein [Clostridia bacterium]|nr:anaerobic ribonucleoside-triphosphate reductase activating protein [Clostridia bacterium]